MTAADVVSDTAKTVTVLVVVGALVVAGVVVLAVTAWFWRASRPDHPVLAPLELMGGRRFHRAGATERALLLDAARPEGAEPERRPIPAPSGPPIDLVGTADAAPESFDDLRDADD
jgi:hypothetical protein